MCTVSRYSLQRKLPSHLDCIVSQFQAVRLDSRHAYDNAWKAKTQSMIADRG